LKVLVLGAGVVGTTCAHYLAAAGHEVTVVERQASAALETSFGNAGGICPSFAGPWAAPGMPLKVVRWLFSRHAPMSVRPRVDPQQWRWLAQFLRNCDAERWRRNKASMQRIAHYSLACLTELRTQTGITFDHGSGGVLQIFRTAEEVEGGRRAASVLASFDVSHRLVDGAGAARIEPALAGALVDIAGALHLPGDETGDCHRFTTALAAQLAGRGVTFRFNTTVTGLVTEAGRLTAVETTAGRLTADATVVALGCEAVHLLRPLGIDLPIYPVKGYAVTLPVSDGAAAPRSSVMDEHSKIMITRLGDRIRAAGVAAVAGYDRTVSRSQCDGIRKVVGELFPAGAPRAEPGLRWAGLRPMTPDGPAYLGPTPVAGLFLNLGQGSNGWTQAAGCGRIVADLVSGRAPEIDLSGMTYPR
jgi:D-amino-acid dehydrogenase